MARIQELVKTYKLINDPSSPSWSIRFVGALLLVALVGAGAFAIAWTSPGHAVAANHVASTSVANDDGTRTDTIYFADYDAALAPDAAKLDAAFAAWHDAHPDARVLSETPVYDATHVHVIGRAIRYG